MRPIGARLSLTIALLMIAAVGLPPRVDAQAPRPAAPASAARPDPGMPCPGIPVRVSGSVQADRTLACEGAAQALRFMAPLDLHAPETLPVELVDRLPAGLRSDAVGCYATGSRRILVLRYAEFQRRREWLGVPVQPALYRAVVAHEVAHAMAACRPSERPLPAAGHEYFAYVVMFASLPQALREQVLHRLPGCGFSDPAQINDMVYGFDPMRFGADAWRHWSRQSDGMDTLRRLLDGQIVDDLPCP